MKQKILSALHLLADIFFEVVLLALCVAAFAVVMISGGGGVSSFRLFGVIQSNSMEPSGLYKGDMVYVSQKEETYAVGDVLVFYRSPSQYAIPAEEADLKNTASWVHEVIDIGTDELGRTTYLTKGTGNATDDGYYVPQDYVLGKAVRLPAPLLFVLRLLTSPAGIIALITVPAAILFLLFTLDLVYLLTKEPTEETASALPRKVKAQKPYVPQTIVLRKKRCFWVWDRRACLWFAVGLFAGVGIGLLMKKALTKPNKKALRKLKNKRTYTRLFF